MSEIISCLQNPGEGQCFVEIQSLMLATGCIDCLPYVQNHQDRVKQFCQPLKSQAACVAQEAPCPQYDLIGAQQTNRCSDAELPQRDCLILISSQSQVQV